MHCDFQRKEPAGSRRYDIRKAQVSSAWILKIEIFSGPVMLKQPPFPQHGAVYARRSLFPQFH